MTNPEMLTQAVMSGLYRAEYVVTSLIARGADVIGVSVKNGLPVIRINRCSFTEHMINTGKASYFIWGSSNHGKYKQGVFIQDNCKVVWSESIH